MGDISPASNLGQSFGKLFKINSKQDDTLKMIAIVSMLIDHVGLVFFPQVAVFRIIGRMALPIFAYYLANGYRYTSNFRQYISRILVFALIAQVPFMLLIDKTKLNILFTFALALVLLYAINKKKYIILIGTFILAFFLPIEYGFYGIISVLIFYFIKNKNAIFFWQGVLVFLYFIKIGVYIQLFSIFSVFLILYFPEPEAKIKLPKYFFYWFYPIHLSLLLIIKYIVDFSLIMIK